MKVLITGGRDYSDSNRLYNVLDNVWGEWKRTAKASDLFILAHGAARGADTLAENWAKSREVRYRGYPAEWAKFGSSAGPRRNGAMLKAFDPDILVVFPGGAGTANMYGLVQRENKRRFVAKGQANKPSGIKEPIRVIVVQSNIKNLFEEGDHVRAY